MICEHCKGIINAGEQVVTYKLSNKYWHTACHAAMINAAALKNLKDIEQN